MFVFMFITQCQIPSHEKRDVFDIERLASYQQSLRLIFDQSIACEPVKHDLNGRHANVRRHHTQFPEAKGVSRFRLAVEENNAPRCRSYLTTCLLYHMSPLLMSRFVNHDRQQVLYFCRDHRDSREPLSFQSM